MENPEEVLQALDEFQKLRPADIPKELEEYLSWVAKTGDPVYQWPLIKALFREKLIRVMTEFYESCPTLELAPCPNVEQFNYDIMKSALLDRLESFANAPFTVQRICELLTSPRKEYNRVDKFMRAIEKNILVVSTREPGPTARRSENGDGMVNGSSEDNGSRSPYDMDLWTRACTLATTVTVQTVETHSAIVNVHNLPTNIIPATELTIVKNSGATTAATVDAFTPYGADGDICENEMSAKSQELPSNFSPSTSEIASIANLTSQIQPQDLNSTSGIQNLSNMVTEPSSIVGDVPEAIMNEDTNSQPSLDMESGESEGFETTRKLQTTFQSSDFIGHSIKSQKFYSQDSKTTEKTVVEDEAVLRNDGASLIEVDRQGENTPVTAEGNKGGEDKTAVENGEPDVRGSVVNTEAIERNKNVEKVVAEAEPSAESHLAVEESPTIERSTAGEEQAQSKGSGIQGNKDVAMDKNVTESALLDISTEKDDVSRGSVNMGENAAGNVPASAGSEALISCPAESSVKMVESVLVSEETEAAKDCEDMKIFNEGDEPVAQVRPDNEWGNQTDETGKSKESEEDSGKVSEDKAQQPLITIEEISAESDTKVNKSLVPDPLPIVEEPKDEEYVAAELEHKEIIVDMSNEEEKKPIDEALAKAESEEAFSDAVQTQDASKISSDTADTECGETKSADTSAPSIQDIVPAESMDVDVAEGSQNIQQDEPMEEEVSDLDKS